ncbi:MAG TPA: copper-binding protein [Candidatus Thermoplasmatota archaeon]|jgi:plastocyanin|nr:copper-binding protein [Candidatus Thermoplasmatota archaeon]
MRAPLALLMLAVLAIAAAPAEAAAIPHADVQILARQFLPPVTAVSSGGTITFHNIEPVDHHQPQALDGSWLVHLGNGQSGDVTITAPSGSQVPYRCGIHVYMTGVIVVV